MLPNTGQVGEPQIDHLDLFVLDRLEDIFGCGAILDHGFTPATESGALKNALPLHSRPGAPACILVTLALRDLIAASVSIRQHDARSCNSCHGVSAASALVRPSHKLHGVFDMSPGLRQFDLTFLFARNGLLSGFRYCLGAVRLQQLPRILVDFGFSHGVVLLSFSVAALSAEPPNHGC
jgi:hypothetical protein